MKAKDAARILEELTLPILMGIVETMKERKTAAILAEMKAERAREITAELARRRAIALSRVSGDAGGDSRLRPSADRPYFAWSGADADARFDDGPRTGGRGRARGVAGKGG